MTDETKEVPQDEVKGTPEEPKGNTPEKTQTLAEQVAHIKEVAGAEVGRAVKAAETAAKSAKLAEDRFNKYVEREKVAAERQFREAQETYRDVPDKLNELLMQRKDREFIDKLEEKEQELSTIKESLKEGEKERVQSTQESNTREIAARLNVDPVLLDKLSKLTDGSKEATEAMAQSMTKKETQEPSEKMVVDSGKTIGGGNTIKAEEIIPSLDPTKMNPAQIRERVKEITRAQEEGRIK